MDALVFKMLAILIIAIILIITSFSAGVDGMHRDEYCPGFTKRFCSCSSTDPMTVHNTCWDIDGKCAACEVKFVDPIHCKDCPGNRCQLCQEKLTLEESIKDNEIAVTDDELIRTFITWTGRNSRNVRNAENSTGEWDPPEDFWCKINRESHGSLNCSIKSHRKECEMKCDEDKYYTFVCLRKELVWKPEFKACEDLEGKSQESKNRQEREIPDAASTFSPYMMTNGTDYTVIPLNYIYKDPDSSEESIIWENSKIGVNVKTTEELEFITSNETELTREVISTNYPKGNMNLASSGFIMNFLNSINSYVFPKTDKEGARPKELTYPELTYEEFGYKSNLAHEIKSTHGHLNESDPSSLTTLNLSEATTLNLSESTMFEENEKVLPTRVNARDDESKFNRTSAAVISYYGRDPKNKYAYVSEEQNNNDAQFPTSVSLPTTVDFETELTMHSLEDDDSKSKALILVPAGLFLLNILIIYIIASLMHNRYLIAVGLF